MSVDIELATGPDAWDDLVERAPHGTPFHRSGCLETAAEHADATVSPLVGYKGEEPVGLFPLFVRSVGPVSAAFSPPPGLKLPYLGPVLLNFEKLKPRKAQRRNRRFVEGCLAWVDERHDPAYVHVRGTTRYDDPRPFRWASFDVSPGYTHVVDITPSESDLLDRFSSDARQNVRNTDRDGVEITTGDAATVARIIDRVRERFADQGKSFPVPEGFATDLYRALPEGVVRPYCCRVDGAFAGGVLALSAGDTVYRWQGGTKPDRDLPVNDLLDWHVIREARDRGIERYDLVGAGDPGISRYKAKFAPSVESYPQLTRTTRLAAVLRSAYKTLR
jgi:CelD/BcsL family acetyltransferase involved in cellulose biosynthesis